MNSQRDPFGYGNLIESIDMPITVQARPVKDRPWWLFIPVGCCAGFGLLFAAQLCLAMVSADLRGHRARAIDTGTAASLLLAIGGGVVAGRAFYND